MSCQKKKVSPETGGLRSIKEYDEPSIRPQAVQRERKYFLSSYMPLCHNKFGREAYLKFGHPPFVDASCRREPDFESPFPSITTICRGKRFAPRLQVGDRVVYMAKKGSAGKGLRHIVAALEVHERFESHSAAASWYRARSLPVPSNCLIRGNPPLGIDHTGHGSPVESDVRRWDLKYQLRVRECGVFLICKPLRIELNNPPVIADEDLIRIFGRVPGIRNPPEITKEAFEALTAWFAE